MYISWTTYSAERGAAAIKPVRCEKCGTVYYYLLTRSVKEKARALYDVGGDGAAQRAAAGAEAMLADAIWTDADPVPCPDCSWLQSDMVAAMRRRHHGWLRSLAFVFIGIGAFLLFGGTYSYLFDSYNPSDRTANAGLIKFGVQLCVPGAALLALRDFVQRTYDPNRAYPKPPRASSNASTPMRVDALPPEPHGPETVFVLQSTRPVDGDTLELGLPNAPPVRRLLGLADVAPAPLLLAELAPSQPRGDSDTRVHRHLHV